MDTSALKTFAPAMRRQLIEAVTRKLDYVLTAETPDYLTTYAKQVASLRSLEAADRNGLIERVAYTWFNRLAALRYIDAKGWHPFHARVLTPADPSETQPELLKLALTGALPDELREYTDPGRLEDLLDGRIPSDDPQGEVYRHLVLATCALYHQMMPFLFEKLDDETELLLPDDLLTPTSIAQGFRTEITDEDCEDVEIIGWLYQFYISEKKDEVIGKVVKSEDIPAATQLFTPNWIVKYLVQNSLGAQWLATYPDSPLKAQMEYYIEPAEQTEEVKAQLATITPETLNPEELTLIDPACGSGHILVEAYELFKAIYLERGYQKQDAAKLILEKNLFGLDIDERAAQLTGFALMMKGRGDDRRFFERGVKLNVMALKDSTDFDAEGLAKALKTRGRVDLIPGDDLFPQTRAQPTLSVPTHEEIDIVALCELKRLFEHATMFGSLIQVPEGLAEKLPALKQLSEATSQDLFVSKALKRLGTLVQQAELLTAQYDAVVMNPPYMGSGGMNGPVKKFAKDYFPDAKSDLFACFIERGCTLANSNGHNAMVTMQSWMFLASFEKMRKRLLREKLIRTMAHLGARAFASIPGEVVQTTAFVLKNTVSQDFKPVFFRLLDGGEVEKSASLAGGGHKYEATAQSDFGKIPGSPIAYWVSEQVLSVFEANETVGEFANPNQALVTGNTERHIRCWWEVAQRRIGFGYHDRESARQSAAKWFPYNKGGPFRNWYGNYWFVVNWENDGHELRTTKHPTSDRIWAHNFVLDQIFSEALVWAKITSGRICFRYSPSGFLFDDASGVCPSTSPEPVKRILAFLVTPVAELLARIASPTLNMQPGDLAALPYVPEVDGAERLSNSLVEKAKSDWDDFEYSWDFQSLPLLTAAADPTPTLESNYTAWITQNRETIAEMQRLEEENNRLFIDAYGLQDELTPDVPIEQITLTVNPAFRYGGKLSEEEQWARFRQDTMKELISYAVGCMMGRYSLDKPGLILANAGDTVENYLKTVAKSADDLKFAPDADGILPILDDEWFADDVVAQFRKFLRSTFGDDSLEENLRFIEDALGKKLRKYLVTDFYKDHLQTYQKRPIYWLVQSPKKGFSALIYLHRYTRDTMNLVLNGYLREYQTKLRARIQHLTNVEATAGSAREKTAARKEHDKLTKTLHECEEWERESLLPAAQARIELDLDDGVKVNYQKFDQVLAPIPGLKSKAKG